MGSGFSKMKKQAKMMQDQFHAAQEKLKQIEETGEAGNGLVKITLNGEKEIKKIEIHPDCVDPSDIEGLVDLILSAHRKACKKVQKDQLIPSFGKNFPF